MLRPRRITISCRDAFLERYERLLRWALLMTSNDHALAEDLLHDLFILFALNPPDLSRIENLDSYLYASLRNLHISQLRRATRARFEQLSVVEYESARLSLHTVTRGRDLIQAQDELRRVCQYVCNRKETAKSASVLILRFFHGYYPSEIARVMRSTRPAVDERMRMARVEAKAYLENGKALTVINSPNTQLSAGVFPTRFARRASDFLLELQQTIFGSRQGECSSEERYRDLYESVSRPLIQCRRFAHIVSCPTCLDLVNQLLGLPLLAERYPTDSMDKDNKKGGDPPLPPKTDRARRDTLTDWERERHEVFEHKPQELCVAVNGYLVGSQLINAELSELTLNLKPHEPVSFCEVFSEQGIRLLMMNVEQLPPDGPGEVRQLIKLSELRTLESILIFTNPFPTIQVTYHDPALNNEAFTEAEGFANERSPIAQGTQKESEQRLKYSSKMLLALRRWLGGSLFWLRPGTITALFAFILIGATFLYLRQSGPLASAADLLHRSTVTEEAINAQTGQVSHRTIDFEEKSGNGELIGRRKIEIWQSAERKLTVRRLFDEHGQLIKGDWRSADGIQTIYQHGAQPKRQTVPEKPPTTVMTSENAWQLSLTAKEFATLIERTDQATVEERPDSYVISYSNNGHGDGPTLSKATIVLSRSDLRALEQNLIVELGGEVRQYRYVESNFERRAPSEVAPEIFEPDALFLNEKAKLEPGKPKPEDRTISPSALTNSPPIVASADLEVEVTYLLNKVKANLGEQVSLTRTPEGQLNIRAIVDSEKRKAEILSALEVVANERALTIDIQTVEEALKRQNKLSSTSVLAGSLTATQGESLPVDSQLRHYLAQRGVSSDLMDGQVREFSHRVIARSRQALRHAYVLKHLAEQFQDQQLRNLSSDAHAKRVLMFREHAQQFERQTRLLRSELEPVFASSSAPSSDSNIDMNIKSETDLAQAVQQLFKLGTNYDKAIGSAFAISSGTSVGPSVNSPQFWQWLKEAEKLAAVIQSAPTVLNDK